MAADPTPEETRKMCLVCGSSQRVEDHHLIPKFWQKLYKGKYSKEEIKRTIPLCKAHHDCMPPFEYEGWTRKAERAKYVVHQLNRKVREYHFTPTNHKHRYKTRPPKTFYYIVITPKNRLR